MKKSHKLFLQRAAGVLHTIAIVAAFILPQTFVASVFIAPATVSAATAVGPNGGSHFESVHFATGDFSWSNPERAQNRDGIDTISNITNSGHPTEYLLATGFGFAVPPGATVNGIRVEITRHQTCNHTGCDSRVADNIVKLLKNNAVVGSNYASTTVWGTSDATAYYGGETALWGETWTPADVNSTNFGVVLSAERTSGGDRTAHVDYMGITVYYTAPTGSISGQKFSDLNGNGVKDEGEQGVSGWTIDLFQNGQLATTATTDGGGNYSFGSLANGSYAVCEEPRPHWSQTRPAAATPGAVQCANGTWGWNATVSGGGAVTGQDFGNLQHGYLTVTKATVPASDPTTFSVSASGNGTMFGETTLPFAVGQPATFEMLPGMYSVSETPPAGWSADTSGCQRITVTSGATATCTITNTRNATLTVTKTTDPRVTTETFSVAVGGATSTAVTLDQQGGYAQTLSLAPGTYTLLESPARNWDFTSATCNGAPYTPGNGLLLAAGSTTTCSLLNAERGSITVNKIANGGEGEFVFTLWQNGTPLASTTFAQTGSYTFTGLLPNTAYSVSETVPAGWTQYPGEPVCDRADQSTTTPDGFMLNPGESVSCTYNNTQYGAISGTKFNDLDENGSRGEGENGLAGWTMNLSQNGQFVATTTTGGNGEYLFGNLLPGTYCVAETMQDGWIQTYPSAAPTAADAALACSGGHSISLAAGGTATGRDFGNFKLGSISGYKFSDLNGNGARDEGEPALTEWTIYLNGGTQTTTDGNGRYEFTGLHAGTYVVTEQARQGWTRTTPVLNYSVPVVSGTVSTGNDFGNFPHAAIAGFKWRDTNGDGARQQGEPGIQEWLIGLGRIYQPDGEGGAALVSIVDTTSTGADGSFSFDIPLPGRYLVLEQERDGWLPTAPATSSERLSVNMPTRLAPEFVTDRYFNVFVTGGGTRVATDTRGNPIQFGNARYTTVLGARFAPDGDDPESATSTVSLDDPATIYIPHGNGTSTVTLYRSTVITRSDDEAMNLFNLTASGMMTESVSGLGTGTVVDSVLQWGLVNLGLEFDPAIHVSIYVGSSYNGQTLSVVRSTSSTSGWTTDGISPASCTVTDGLCSFSATKASYYVAMTPATPSPTPAPTTGGGGTIFVGGAQTPTPAPTIAPTPTPPLPSPTPEAVITPPITLTESTGGGGETGGGFPFAPQQTPAVPESGTVTAPPAPPAVTPGAGTGMPSLTLENPPAGLPLLTASLLAAIGGLWPFKTGSMNLDIMLGLLLLLAIALIAFVAYDRRVSKQPR